MANYTFIDASGNTQTAGSSVVGGVNYPVVKISDPVSVIGTLSQTGTNISSISGIVEVNSVIGTYAEDAQHVSGDKGMFVLGVRNDTMASITSLDSDYSPMARGPIGEAIVANAPLTKWVQGVASVLNPAQASVAVIAPQGSSIFTYITALQVSNYAPTSVLLALYGATSSIVGFAVASGNATIPIYYPNGLKTNANGAFSASVIGGNVPSVYLSAQGFISKT